MGSPRLARKRGSQGNRISISHSQEGNGGERSKKKKGKKPSQERTRGLEPKRKKKNQILEKKMGSAKTKEELLKTLRKVRKATAYVNPDTDTRSIEGLAKRGEREREGPCQ